MSGNSLPSRDLLLLNEQLLDASRVNRHLIFVYSVFGLYFCIALKAYWGTSLLIGSLVAICALIAAHVVWNYKFWRAAPAPELSAVWLNRWVILRGTGGIVWGGSGAALITVADLIGNPIIIPSLLIFAAGSLAGSSYKRANYAFAIPLLVPVITRLTYIGTAEAISWAIQCAIFLSCVLGGTRKFENILITSFNIRFENRELLKALNVEKAISEKAREDAELANRSKSRFLAAASHDLRQPMHALNLYLGTLSGFDLPERARAIFGNALQCANMMEKLFNALLEMSRLDSSTVTPEVVEFPISSILDRIRVQFEPEAKAKGLGFEVIHSAAVVHSDPALIERIMSNFVTNAIRYTKQGKILVGCRRKGTQIRLGVYDTGPGIPADAHRIIFEEFYQIDNPERDRGKGLGLGLAIVERLARLLSVPITLISKHQCGSMFAIDIRLAIADSRVATLKRVSVVEKIGKNSYEHLTDKLVVVIDDEAMILDASRTLLEQWGCIVVTAASKDDAIQKLAMQSRAPDVLICDYRLRGEENGVDAIAALRDEFNQDVPALLITGDSWPERIQEVLTSSLPVLYKPLQKEDLLKALSALIDSRHRGNSVTAKSQDPSAVPL